MHVNLQTTRHNAQVAPAGAHRRHPQSHANRHRVPVCWWAGVLVGPPEATSVLGSMCNHERFAKRPAAAGTGACMCVVFTAALKAATAAVHIMIGTCSCKRPTLLFVLCSAGCTARPDQPRRGAFRHRLHPVSHKLPSGTMFVQALHAMFSWTTRGSCYDSFYTGRMPCCPRNCWQSAGEGFICELNSGWCVVQVCPAGWTPGSKTMKPTPKVRPQQQPCTATALHLPACCPALYVDVE